MNLIPGMKVQLATLTDVLTHAIRDGATEVEISPRPDAEQGVCISWVDHVGQPMTAGYDAAGYQQYMVGNDSGIAKIADGYAESVRPRNEPRS